MYIILIIDGSNNKNEAINYYFIMNIYIIMRIESG